MVIFLQNTSKEIVEFLTDGATQVIPEPFISTKRSYVVWLASPANLLITDPQGRRIGFDPLTQSIVNDFPDAFYSGPDSNPEFIEIADPEPGEHLVQLIGTNNGEILTGAVLVNSEGKSNRIEEARTVKQGEVTTYSLVLQSAGTPDEIAIIYTTDPDNDGQTNDEEFRNGTNHRMPDSDQDGASDSVDSCPNDINKTIPGVCGCGVVDTDSDNDGTPNCLDLCPNDPSRTVPSPEVCDGLDDNCNGIVDEGNPGGGAACSTGKSGVCGAGTLVCTNGTSSLPANYSTRCRNLRERH